MTAQIVTEEHVTAVLTAIVADAAEFGFPLSEVTSFADLHDHVDANEYGAVTGVVFPEADDSDDSRDAEIAFLNRLFNEVDSRIKSEGWDSIVRSLQFA